jgi:hypothetical protein
MHSENSVFKQEHTKALLCRLVIRNLRNTSLTHEISTAENAIDSAATGERPNWLAVCDF